MSSPTVHIIGAGLAGLSAAIAATENGRQVVIHEASAQAGGRCRSYYDKKLKRTIDNGNHLILGANQNVLAYMARLGSLGSCITQTRPRFSFIDLPTRQHWHFMPPRFPGIPWQEWPKLLKLIWPKPEATVADCIPEESRLFQRLIEPLTLAALNTPPQEASARMLADVLRPLLSGGKAAWQTYVPASGLSASLIEPALFRLKADGAKIHYNQSVQSFETANGRVKALVLHKGKVHLGPQDNVVCAVAPSALKNLLPEIAPDFTYSPILNAHFIWPQAGMFREAMPLLGLIRSHVQWIFFHEGCISTTTSAASGLIDYDEAEVAQLLWDDVCRALFIPQAALPAYRIIKEKRATITATPENLAKRPSAATPYDNLALAGDYLNVPIPSTLEAAISTGERAGIWACQ